MTPTPWRLTFTGAASTPDWSVETTDGRTVATLPAATGRNAARTRYEAELLALAPALRDALRALLNTYPEGPHVGAPYTPAGAEARRLLASLDRLAV